MSKDHPASANSSGPELRLAELGLTLPPPPTPPGSYIPSRREGGLLFVAGQLPFVNGRLALEGRLGENLVTREGVAQAKLATLNALAIAKEAAGDLDGIGVVHVSVFVACAPTYFEHHLVANAASEFLVAVLGENGRHTRTSVGVASLPFNGPVEVEVLFAMAG